MDLNLPNAIYNRAVGHWTGGGYTPNAGDRAAYHLVIDGDGAPVLGSKPLDANAVGRRLVGAGYYAHTRNFNSGSFGLSIAAMGGAYDQPLLIGRSPVVVRQVDAYARIGAELCRHFGFEPTREFFPTHAEVPITFGIAQAGKWDIRWLPGMKALGNAVSVGDELRQEIAVQLASGEARPPAVTIPSTRPTIRRGAPAAHAEHVRHLQRQLTIHGFPAVDDGVFGPNTENRLRAFQRSRQLRVDGIVGPMTWISLG
jgi:hypothetical protein